MGVPFPLPRAPSAPAKAPQAGAIRVMIVDDSIVVRTILERMLAQRAEFEVVATAPRVDAALTLLERVPVDVILLDVEMPGIDGLTALPELVARSRGARVLILSSLCATGAAACVRAMAQGAADTMLKPSAGSFGSRFEDQLAERIARIGRREPPLAEREELSRRAPEVRRPASSARLDCVAIGSSTGGLHALIGFFGAIPASFDVPCVVTQHLPPVFMPFFAAQLAEAAGRPCAVAADGDPLEPGRVLVAPGDAHAEIVRRGAGLRIHLSHDGARSGCLPSVDPMLASLGEAVGAGGLGVVLSGMGRDGEAGAAALVAAGGEVIAQDMGTSVVWGMPGAVARGGYAALVAPPPQLAEHARLRWELRP